MRSHLNRIGFLRFSLIFAVVALVSLGAQAVELPDSPDGTVKTIVKSLAEQHPEVLWQALPASYQKDITDVTRAFAAQMDPQLWDSGFDLGGKAAGVLRDKKQYILESSFMDAAGEERDRVEGNWDTAVAMINDFFSSEVSELENLKTIDWEKYLSTTCAEIMTRAQEISTASDGDKADQDLIEQLRQTTVELVSHEGDSATVKVSTPGEDPEEIPLVKVEGRWVPADMAEEWDAKIAEAKQNIAELSGEEMAENKMQAMMMIGMADAMLDQLAQVNSTEEFEQAMQGILGPFMGMGAAMEEELTEETTEGG